MPTPRPRPRPPRPELVRRPSGSFGWLDARLLHEGRLRELGPDAVATLVLLALAADRQGASFFSRRRMANDLRLTRAALDAALSRLVDLGLVAHRPWRPGQADGVWQLLPLPDADPAPTAQARAPRGKGEPMSIAAVLAQLGFSP